MVVRKNKKHRKFRGYRTYHGSHKKHRGGGSRGGRGLAGLHKHKWSYTVKYMPDHFGKHGFKIPQKVLRTSTIRSITLKDLDRGIDKLIEKKVAKKEGSSIKINLADIGYDKLLGTGKTTKKLIVEAKLFSKNAERKLGETGGKAVVEKKEVKG